MIQYAASFSRRPNSSRAYPKYVRYVHFAQRRYVPERNENGIPLAVSAARISLDYESAITRADKEGDSTAVIRVGSRITYGEHSCSRRAWNSSPCCSIAMPARGDSVGQRSAQPITQQPCRGLSGCVWRIPYKVAGATTVVRTSAPSIMPATSYPSWPYTSIYYVSDDELRRRALSARALAPKLPSEVAHRAYSPFYNVARLHTTIAPSFLPYVLNTIDPHNAISLFFRPCA